MKPDLAPLRVDFAGGWLDVPELSRPGEFIVNCAISPLVSLEHWPYHKNAGLGGSAAFHLLNGRDPLAEELKAGVGWQDPAVIKTTGFCVWESGVRPKLRYRNSGRMLRGIMALYWTGEPHDTAAIKSKDRDYTLICAAGRFAAKGETLLRGVQFSYDAQLAEGMKPLNSFDSIAFKYCGSGWGGYALYIFKTEQNRDAFVLGHPEKALAIEPYDGIPK